MTFQEYLNQTDPVRNPNVEITVDDCYAIYPNPVHDHLTVVLKISGRFITYVMTPDTGRLWTTDQDGNKQSRSVFSFLKIPANDSY